nr:transposase [Pseudonocardia sp. ICBG1142]
MYYTTGFRRDEIQDLVAIVYEQDQRDATEARLSWPPVLGLFWSVVITLAYLRGNRVQWELAETYGVSQSTVSRAITGVTPLLAQALRSVVPTAEELRADRQYIIDGTLLPCWSWAAVPGLWSGKHRTTGVVVQVAATLEGQLSWISDPTPGSDTTYIASTNPAPSTTSPHTPRGDKGYIGRGMLTPFKKPPGRELLNWQKHSTRASTTHAPPSNESSLISKRGKFSTQTTGGPTPHLKRQSRQSSDSSSTHLPDGA